VGEELEMTADGRLRKLQHRAQLRHGELVALDQAQDARPGRIGQGAHPGENLRRGAHRFIRRSGWKVTWRGERVKPPSERLRVASPLVRCDSSGMRDAAPRLWFRVGAITLLASVISAGPSFAGPLLASVSTDRSAYAPGAPVAIHVGLSNQTG